MTPISISTYTEGEYIVLELQWFDNRLRKPQSIRAGMDRERVESLIKELQEMVK